MKEIIWIIDINSKIFNIIYFSSKLIIHFRLGFDFDRLSVEDEHLDRYDKMKLGKTVRNKMDNEDL
jgi:hypothetical protein